MLTFFDRIIDILVGYDKYSYSYRDIEGCAVHDAKRKPYGSPYKVGDVIGFYISLPPLPEPIVPQSTTTDQLPIEVPPSEVAAPPAEPLPLPPNPSSVQSLKAVKPELDLQIHPGTSIHPY